MLSNPNSAPSVGSSVGDVDVDRQQVADCVGVFGAIQTMHDVAARRAPRASQARSSESASQLVKPAYSASGGRGMPCGGIARTLSLRSTLSQVAAWPADRRGWPSRD